MPKIEKAKHHQLGHIQPMIQITPEEYKCSMDRSEVLQKIIKGTRNNTADTIQYYIEWEKNVQRIIRERGGNV